MTLDRGCRWRLLAPLAFTLIGGCAAPHPAQPDLMCEHIAAFASAAVDKAPYSVKLTTDWSNWSKQCEHGDTEQGKTLCRYLILHSSTEFAQINFRRAAACMNKAQSIGPHPLFHSDYLTAKFTSYDAQFVRDNVAVTLEFSEGVQNTLPYLKITAAQFN